MNPETLKAWRARLSLGEAGMAAYLGVPVTTYRKWENGTRKPDAAPLRLFEVLQRIEQTDNAQHLHENFLASATEAENKPQKARKPRAAVTASATPEKRASGPDSQPCAAYNGGHCDCVSQSDCKLINTHWIHAADALPAWMNGSA